MSTSLLNQSKCIFTVALQTTCRCSKHYSHMATSYRFLGAGLRDESVFWPSLADIIITGHELPLTFPLVEEQWEGGGPIKQERAVRFC